MNDIIDDNPNKDIKEVKASEWSFTPDGTYQYQLLSGKAEGKEGFVYGVQWENSEWPYFNRDKSFETRDKAVATGFETEIKGLEKIKAQEALEEFINPDKPPVVSRQEREQNLRGIDQLINEPVQETGIIEKKIATPWAARIDGSQVRLTAAKLKGEDKYVSGFDHVAPDRPMQEIDTVWDMENTKHKSLDAAFGNSVKFQADFQSKYEKDIDMAAEKAVSEIIVEGIKNIKDPVRRAKAMEVAGKMAVQSAGRKNENVRTDANRGPRPQERAVERSRDRDVDIER